MRNPHHGIGASIMALLFSATFVVNAQQVIQGTKANQMVEGAQLVRTSQFSSLPSFIRFKPGNEIELGKAHQWIVEQFGLNFQHELKLIGTEKDKLGMVHYRYQQIYNGVKVKNGIWILHTKFGKVVSMNGLLYPSLPVAGSAALSEADALAKALQHVNAKIYKWQVPVEEEFIKQTSGNPQATYYPKGELTYATKGSQHALVNNHLVYSFNIYAKEPLYRADVLVDANTGEIIGENEHIHEADVVGTAVTAYSGTQPMTADSFGGGYRLRETGRGDGINTYNMLTGTDYGAAVDFTDADNTWNNVNAAQDEVATDAHWGAEKTYDYYMLKHSRNSIDDAGFALNSYVHYDVGFVNAFWDGSVMTYGDGDGTYSPLTSIDIAGHEITHGLTTFTANLDYADESGALNESFSDIFGVAIEWYANFSTADWLMGEDIGAAFRSMSNPGAYGDPDTYFGTNWAPLGGADNGGVHTNSGVQNFWFYLLANGGTGTNDNGDAYNVTGLGLDQAGEIAFRNLTVYLTNTSQFADARFYAIQSAVDLFGGCSPEVEATTNAWYAVGVGPEYVAEVVAGFTPNTTGGCTNPLTVDFANGSINGINYTWDFGDGGTSTAANPSHTYTVDGVYTVSLIADGGLCGIDTLVVTDQIFVGQLPDPVVTDGGRCDPGVVTLGATGLGTVSWFTNASGGSSIATGTTYTTPSLSTTTTYYVEAETGGTSTYLGPTSTAIGTTGTTSSNRWLIFDAFQPFTLVSVWVNANTAGNRTVELRNSAGTVLQSATINIPLGTSRITLNFNVPVGTSLQLGTDAASVPTNLLRNSTGVTYPYTVSGLASITGSSGGSSFYYFFYDWECVQTPCSSNRVPVVAAITSTGPTTLGDSRCGAGVVNLSATGSTGTLNWYTAPTGGTLVNTGPMYSPSISATTSYYVEEQMPGTPSYVGPADNTFGTGGYFSGDQHLLFDVSAACTLQSVRVFAGSTANRTIQLRNSAGAVLQSITVNIPSGDQRVTLGFPLTPGTGYQLGWATGSSPDLYRNNAGPSYPYTIAGLVSITSSSAGTGFYYGYYDWEVLLPGCITARTMVTGTVGSTADASITPAGPFCSSDASTNLTAVDPGGLWTGTGIIDGTNGTFDPSVGAGTYTITYTISGTCGAIGTQDIVVTDQYDATITSGAVCTGDGPVNLTAVDAGGIWSGTGITNTTLGTFDPSVGAGTYQVIYTIAGTCGNADTTDITVTNSADASFGVPLGTICSDANPFTLTPTQTGGTWTASCGTCINATTGEFDPASAGVGTWDVTYMISGTCGDTQTLSVSVQNCSGFNDQNNLFNVAVYPNPANDFVQLLFTSSNALFANVSITNAVGQMVWNENNVAMNKTIQVNTSVFANGVYMVKASVDGYTKVVKLIVR